MADAGRILIMPKGTYDASVSYERLDLVRHNGNVWLAKKNAVGVEPSTANEEYWFDMNNSDATTLGGLTADDWQAKIDAKADSSHTHTKAQVGLGNVDNTADADKSVNYANSAGSANAVAWGNVSGKPSTFTPATHSHTKSQISDFPATMKPSSHNQGASTITAGTLAGKILANATSSATVTDKQIRNIYAGTTDMTAGTTALTSGDIYVFYE
jgi:hypothetical protein